MSQTVYHASPAPINVTPVRAIRPGWQRTYPMTLHDARQHVVDLKADPCTQKVDVLYSKGEGGLDFLVEWKSLPTQIETWANLGADDPLPDWADYFGCFSVHPPYERNRVHRLRHGAYNQPFRETERDLEEIRAAVDGYFHCPAGHPWEPDFYRRYSLRLESSGLGYIDCKDCDQMGGSDSRDEGWLGRPLGAYETRLVATMLESSRFFDPFPPREGAEHPIFPPRLAGEASDMTRRLQKFQALESEKQELLEQVMGDIRRMRQQEDEMLCVLHQLARTSPEDLDDIHNILRATRDLSTILALRAAMRQEAGR